MRNREPDFQARRAVRFGSRFRSTRALTTALHERDEHTRAYDAMRNARPYRQPKSHDEVMSILESESDWKFAPGLFEQFRAVAEELRFAKDC